MNFNILFVTSFEINPPLGGGVGRVTYTLANEFRRMGHKVFYLTLKEGKQELVNDVRQYYIPNSVQLHHKLNIEYIKRIIKTNHIDFVINQAGIYEDIFNLLRKAITENVKLITVHHNCVGCLLNNYRHILLNNDKFRKFFEYIDFPVIWYILKFRNKLKYGRYFSNVINHSDRLVLLAETFKEELRTYTKKFDGNKVVSIPNPLPFPVLKDAEKYKENRLLYVGRIESIQKQAELLIELWERIYRNFQDWEFDIVGDGSIKKQLEQSVKNKYLERIYFHGYCDPEPFYKKAKIFLLTSAFEGFGMVLVEAQSYGVVPIAFNCFSNIRAIIEENKTGFIIEKNNVENFVKKIELLIQDENKRKSMSISCQKASLNFSKEKISAQWNILFHNLKNA